MKCILIQTSEKVMTSAFEGCVRSISRQKRDSLVAASCETAERKRNFAINTFVVLERR